ncbi:formamidopyrimidine-DNA glycosylase [soil metagenome]
MPELAEVEYIRKQWNVGLGKKVTKVMFHPKARIFRGIEAGEFEKALTGAKLISSEARGKQMIFRFSTATLGIHLGMTGELEVEKAGFEPGRHDHLVLVQAKQALVFSDTRLFGRVLFARGKADPQWWKDLPPAIASKEFTEEAMAAFLKRRKGAPIKAVLLMQERFPGVGNWMADEILWQARISPRRLSGKLSEEEVSVLWKTIRHVCKEAVRIIGKDWGDPPDSWLINHRWKHGNDCPRCGLALARAEIGGRTTCWCKKCQAR